MNLLNQNVAPKISVLFGFIGALSIPSLAPAGLEVKRMLETFRCLQNAL